MGKICFYGPHKLTTPQVCHNRNRLRDATHNTIDYWYFHVPRIFFYESMNLIEYCLQIKSLPCLFVNVVFKLTHHYILFRVVIPINLIGCIFRSNILQRNICIFLHLTCSGVEVNSFSRNAPDIVSLFAQNNWLLNPGKVCTIPDTSFLVTTVNRFYLPIPLQS